MKPINIIHIINPYLFHTGSWIYAQLKGVREINNHVFTYRKQNINQYPIDSIYDYTDFSFIKKVFSKLYRVMTNGNSGLFFGKYLKQIKPAIIHAHMGYEAARWVQFAYNNNIPMVTTFYGLDVSKLGRIPYWQKKYKKLFKHGKLFLAEGNNLKKQLINLGCEENKIIVQHLGVNFQNYLPKDNYKNIANKPFRIIQVSSFREKKGIEYSLEAISYLNKNDHNIEFNLIGDSDEPSYKNKLISLIRFLNIDDCVNLLGIRDHKETLKLIADADLFLHPSVTASNGDNEGGAPVGIIEASAIGLPIVSTYHADIPEVVLHNKSGLLVEERNGKALADEIEKLIKNPGLRKTFGVNGRNHIAENYNLDIQLRKLENIYRQVIDEK